MKTTVISVLGNRKDAYGGSGASRWNVFRPNIALVQQPELVIDELHLILDERFASLADLVRADINQVSPKTKVIYDVINLNDPWDFEEVYGKFFDFAQKPCFHEERTNYFIHISTGSHVEQICLFLLTESRNLPGKLVQTAPLEGHGSRANGAAGTCSIIDLDLSRYDKLAKRFEVKRQNDVSFLKQGIETKSKSFNRLIDTIERVAIRSNAPLLLTGPTGAGKTQLATLIYELRKKYTGLTGDLVKVNCAALNGETLHPMLFGAVPGAYTGQKGAIKGFLKSADNGVLFLDEIGTLPLETQAMLLKAIEERTFRPLGADKDEKSDFQLICGTNEDLSAAVAERRFRLDLLERIRLWHFRLPGLAERREDIEPNLDFELDRYNIKTGQHVSFNKEARKRFLEFALDPKTPWNGNFRELNAMVTRMATLCDGGRITVSDVNDEIARSQVGSKSGSSAVNAGLAGLLGLNYLENFDSFDLAQLSYVIEVCRDSRSAADASLKLFSVSLKSRKSSNNSDRLTKYLAKFGLKFKDLI